MLCLKEVRKNRGEIVIQPCWGNGFNTFIFDRAFHEFPSEVSFNWKEYCIYFVFERLEVVDLAFCCHTQSIPFELKLICDFF